MGLAYSIDVGARRVDFTVAGEVSYEEWEAMIREIFSDPRHQSGFNFLSDRRLADPPPTVDAIRRGMAYFEIHRQRFGSCRWALVVSGPAAYGMGRMTEALSAETGIRVRVFTDMNDATRWLNPDPVEQD